MALSIGLMPVGKRPLLSMITQRLVRRYSQPEALRRIPAVQSVQADQTASAIPPPIAKTSAHGSKRHQLYSAHYEIPTNSPCQTKTPDQPCA